MAGTVASGLRPGGSSDFTLGKLPIFVSTDQNLLPGHLPFDPLLPHQLPSGLCVEVMSLPSLP